MKYEYIEVPEQAMKEFLDKDIDYSKYSVSAFNLSGDSYLEIRAKHIKSLVPAGLAWKNLDTKNWLFRAVIGA